MQKRWQGLPFLMGPQLLVNRSLPEELPSFDQFSLAWSGASSTMVMPLGQVLLPSPSASARNGNIVRKTDFRSHGQMI
jgi:hypothetical protein